MSGDEYRSGDVFENVRAIAADLDHRWPSMHREPVVATQRRDAHGRFAKNVGSRPATAAEMREFTDFSYLLSARDLVDTSGVRATLRIHFPSWGEPGPPLFEEALKAIEEQS